MEQYLAALTIDPTNAEARATLGFVLYLSGKPEEGLASVRQALASDPRAPEARYYEGVILLEGMHRRAEAADAFRAAGRGRYVADVRRRRRRPGAAGNPVTRQSDAASARARSDRTSSTWEPNGAAARYARNASAASAGRCRPSRRMTPS